ncbi:MAG: hypothetical protein NTW32_14415 [Chloroflexi bacterium]|nr:hypothetical protein [Chloroflexota bacterium]
MMNRKPWIFAVLLLMLASLACNAVTGIGKKVPTPPADGIETLATQAPDSSEIPELPTSAASNPEPPAANQPGTDPKKFDTEFPIPADSSGFIDLGNGSVNFQTKTSLKEVIAFYRESFLKRDIKEREINTAITDATFSLVFDGHTSGKAIVVQGVDLGNNTVNINIRFEDI